MSQSDYIQHKKTSSILKTNSLPDSEDLEAVLSPSDYTKFKQYTIMNTIENTQKTKNLLLNTNKQRIFNMEKNVENCPNIFVVCKKTHTRFNKTSNIENTLFRGYKRQIPMYEFALKRKLKTKYPEAFSEYPDLKSCELMGKCDEYFYLRDQRPSDNDEDVMFFIG